MYDVAGGTCAPKALFPVYEYGLSIEWYGVQFHPTARTHIARTLHTEKAQINGLQEIYGTTSIGHYIYDRIRPIRSHTRIMTGQNKRRYDVHAACPREARGSRD